MKKVLVVEDDVLLAKSISQLVSQKMNHETAIAFNLDQAINHIDQNTVDLVILDWMLDQDCGLELIDYLNQYSFQSKILMLTQKKAINERLKGLKTGADDYLCKPFDADELQIRIQHLLNFYRLSAQDKVELGLFKLSIKSGTLKINDKVLQLAARECQIMALLMINSPKILSKFAIINQIWTQIDSQPTINTVEVYIRRIRIKLGKYQGCLKTKRGFGYYLVKGN
ncbi:MAG: response regulator transcription factor [Patescibacteria group bacterium]|nr:response regulator transcription factor [Patescibacteria group bacterium]